MKEARINKLRGGLDCGTVCFGLKGKCHKMCEGIKGAMTNSTSYPCTVAGFCPEQGAYDDEGQISCRWSYKKLGCLPEGGMCVHRLPTTCELRPGIRQWRRVKKFVLRDVEALGAAFQRRAKYCSEEGSGNVCIRDAVGVGFVCQNLGYMVIVLIGTYLTVRAIESPGGADDRQWLVFWLLMFSCSYLERFTDMLLSWLPRYYELKLVFLLWLMFSPPSGGAEKLYRLARRRLRLAEAFGRHFGTVAASDDDYVQRLPKPVREEVARRGSDSLRAVLDELCTSEADVVDRYGAGIMPPLYTHWNAVDPAVVIVRIISASNLPVMDPGVLDEFRATKLKRAADQSKFMPRSWGDASEAISNRISNALAEPLGRATGAIGLHEMSERIANHLADTPKTVAKHDKVDPYVVATLVPPAQSLAQSAGSPLKSLKASPSSAFSPPPKHKGSIGRHDNRYRVATWAPKFSSWARVRLLVSCLTLVVHWRRRATSLAAVRAAIMRRKPIVAAARLYRLARQYVPGLRDEGSDALIGTRSSGIFSHAFHGGPLGPVGQYSRRRSRVKHRSSEPRWNQTLELRLPSRPINYDGTHSGNTVAPFTKLRLEVWDCDYFSRDDFIGEATIPLTPALDGRRHRYTLALSDPEGVFAGHGWDACNQDAQVVVEVSLES